MFLFNLKGLWVYMAKEEICQIELKIACNSELLLRFLTKN